MPKQAPSEVDAGLDGGGVSAAPIAYLIGGSGVGGSSGSGGAGGSSGSSGGGSSGSGGGSSGSGGGSSGSSGGGSSGSGGGSSGSGGGSSGSSGSGSSGSSGSGSSGSGSSSSGSSGSGSSSSGSSAPCFLGRTHIATPSGERPIASLRVGDLVWSYDSTQRRCLPRAITRVHQGRSQTLVDLVTEGAHLLGATPGHPFFDVDDGAFVLADRLEPGRRLLLRHAAGDATPATIQRLERRFVHGGVDVFNLSLDGPGGYFAAGLLALQKKAPARTLTAARSTLRLPVTLGFLVAVACDSSLTADKVDATFPTDVDNPVTDTDTDTDADSDSDTDADTDTDTDSDTDSDTDTDTDADTDTVTC